MVEVAALPLDDVVVGFFLWTGIVPSLWKCVGNTSRNGICLYYSLEYPSLGRPSFTHKSGWHHYSPPWHGYRDLRDISHLCILRVALFLLRGLGRVII